MDRALLWDAPSTLDGLPGHRTRYTGMRISS